VWPVEFGRKILDAGHEDVSFALRNSALSRPAQTYLGLEKMIVD
jgi:hypothetical protein